MKLIGLHLIPNVGHFALSCDKCHLGHLTSEFPFVDTLSEENTEGAVTCSIWCEERPCESVISFINKVILLLELQ